MNGNIGCNPYHGYDVGRGCDGALERWENPRNSRVCENHLPGTGYCAQSSERETVCECCLLRNRYNNRICYRRYTPNYSAEETYRWDIADEDNDFVTNGNGFYSQGEKNNPYTNFAYWDGPNNKSQRYLSDNIVPRQYDLISRKTSWSQPRNRHENRGYATKRFNSNHKHYKNYNKSRYWDKKNCETYSNVQRFKNSTIMDEFNLTTARNHVNDEVDTVAAISNIESNDVGQENVGQEKEDRHEMETNNNYTELSKEQQSFEKQTLAINPENDAIINKNTNINFNGKEKNDEKSNLKNFKTKTNNFKKSHDKLNTHDKVNTTENADLGKTHEKLVMIKENHAKENMKNRKQHDKLSANNNLNTNKIHQEKSTLKEKINIIKNDNNQQNNDLTLHDEVHKTHQTEKSVNLTENKHYISLHNKSNLADNSNIGHIKRKKSMSEEISSIIENENCSNAIKVTESDLKPSVIKENIDNVIESKKFKKQYDSTCINENEIEKENVKKRKLEETRIESSKKIKVESKLESADADEHTKTHKVENTNLTKGDQNKQSDNYKNNSKSKRESYDHIKSISEPSSKDDSGKKSQENSSQNRIDTPHKKKQEEHDNILNNSSKEIDNKPKVSNSVISTSNLKRKHDVTNTSGKTHDLDGPEAKLHKGEVKKLVIQNTKHILSENISKNSVKQLKLLLMLIKEKLKSNHEISLLTEVIEAKCLSDAIFCFEKRNKTEEKIDCSLYQVKYLLPNENGQIPKIDLQMLSSHDYSIERFYNFYIDFIKSPSFSKGNKIIKDFTIYSNLELDKAAFEKKNITVVSGSKPNSYKLVVNEENELYKFLLKKSSSISALANVIAVYILNKGSVNLTGLMKKYHMALIHENVLEIKVKKDNGKRYTIGKFHQNFIEGKDLSEAARELRHYIKKYLKSPITEDMELNLNSSFGKDFILNRNPMVEKLNKLATELVTVISSSMTMPTEKIQFRKNPSLKEDIDKITGHILHKKDKDTVVFTETFLNYNINLPGNLNTLRDMVKDKLKLKDINFNSLDQCKFKIHDFRDKELDDVAKYLPNENCKNIIHEFLSVLEFAVSKVNVDNTITEIGEEFNLICDEYSCNAVQEELLMWLRLGNYKINPFDLLKSKISKLMVVNQSLIQHDTPLETSIEFKKDCLKEIERSLTNNNGLNNVIFIETDCITFSAQKVRQIVKYFPDYLENQGSMFIKFDALINMPDRVYKAFESPLTKLLVVECDNLIVKVENMSSICKQLKDIITNSQNDIKKLVIIGNIERFPAKFRAESIMIHDIHNNLTDVMESSRCHLLQKVNILLHKNKLNLTTVVDESGLQSLINTPELLLQLIKNKISVGLDPTIPRGFDEDCYIRRRLKQYIIIQPTIFKENTDDVFVISGIEKTDFREFTSPNEKICYFYELNSNMKTEARFILLGSTKITVSFNLFISKNEGKNIHLLKYESKNFVWRKSKGSMSVLFKYRIEDSSVLLKSKTKQDVLINGNDNIRTVIISGDSGSGKSVYLYNMAKTLLVNSKDNRWVIQVNLSKSLIDRHKGRQLEKNKTAIDFLADILGFDRFHQRLLRLSLNGKAKLKLILFFDGFDELHSRQADLIINLLKRLQNTHVDKIFISTRPNMKTKLESELGVFSFSLDSFTHDEKIEYLVKYWSKVRSQENNMHDHAENILETYEDNNVDLTITPLQLTMLANIHKEDLDICVQDNYDLYKRFIEYHLQKTHATDDFVEEQQKLSLKRLLNPVDFERLGFTEEALMSTRDEYILDNLISHVTFAEYFAAEWLVEHRYSEKLQNTIFDCIDSLIENTSPVFISTVVALLQINTKSGFQGIINIFSKSGHANLLEALLKLQINDYSDADVTPLHIATESNNLRVVKFLLEHYNDTGVSEIMENGDFKCPEYAESKLIKFVNKPSRGKTAIELAADNTNVALATELVLMGADVSVLKKSFLHMLTQYVATEIAKVEAHQHHRLQSIAEKLLKMAPQAAAHLDKKYQYPRLLSYFFTNGRIEVIKCLLNALDNETEKYKLLETSVSGKTPLDYINNSVSMRDEERLEITKFLMEKIGSELHSKDENYLYSVLQAAVKCDHTRTFEYFIDQHPGGHSGFFKLSLQNNQLDVLEFLMRNSEWTVDRKTGNTALHTAVCLGVNLKTIKFLIDKGGINNTNDEGDNPLCVAIKKGVDLLIIKYLVKHGANANAEDKKGFFPWCYAILKETSHYNKDEQLDLMSFLLWETQSGIKMPIVKNRSYLCDKWLEEIERKLEFFQDPDGYDINYEKGSDTPRLHIAVKSDDLNWCTFLIAHGANVNLKDPQGKTALHVAVEFNRHNIVKILLHSGAVFNADDDNNQTPLQILESKCKQSPNKEEKETLELLKKAGNFFASKKLTMLLEKHHNDNNLLRHLANCHDRNGRNLIHVAAETNSLGALKMLTKFISNRKDVNARDVELNTPIHYAARKGYKEFVAEIMARGACFESINSSCKTAIDLARESSCLETIKLLDTVRKFFDATKLRDYELAKKCLNKDYRIVNARDTAGRSSLHLAVTSDENIKLVKELIRNDYVAVDALDFFSKTALHYAAESNSIECVKALLKAGAMIDVKDIEKCRPFDLVKTNASVEMLRLIYKLFEDIHSDNPKIFTNDSPKALLNYLHRIYGIEKDIVINVRDCKRNTLMHYAAMYNYPGVVENLLKIGSTYNSENKMKHTPGHYARGHAKKLLQSVDKLFKKIDVASWSNVKPEIVVKCRTIGGYTLLHEAVKKGKIKEVKWLVEHGADIRASSNKGNNVLQRAKKFPEIAILLDKRICA